MGVGWLSCGGGRLTGGTAGQRTAPPVAALLRDLVRQLGVESVRAASGAQWPTVTALVPERNWTAPPGPVTHIQTFDAIAGLVRALTSEGLLVLVLEPDPDAKAVATVGLTERQREVLALLCEGLTNPAIGKRLYLSPNTASVHVSRILAKLGATNRTQAATAAHRLGLDRPTPER